ncbi:UNVERIFIED_CONTAM: hypothetical protein GTU68_016697, partial [Idotea baltica]|nr:hypothetical protein [Idotea baltica]
QLDVLNNVNLKVESGEFVAIVGFSGAGKTTLVSALAGLVSADSGGVLFHNKELTEPDPNIGVVFQSYSLMPWLSVQGNIGLAVDTLCTGLSRSEKKANVDHYIELVGLTPARTRKPAQLSGGMRQRVALARALATKPELLLLDEPFGMLDSVTRWELQDVLMEVWERTKVTTICVTHDVDEAILLADRVVMMSNGPMAKVGNIMDVELERPRSREALLSHPDYYVYREELMEFLEAYEGGANPDQSVLDSIAQKRRERLGQQNQNQPLTVADSSHYLSELVEPTNELKVSS